MNIQSRVSDVRGQVLRIRVLKPLNSMPSWIYLRSGLNIDHIAQSLGAYKGIPAEQKRLFGLLSPKPVNAGEIAKGRLKELGITEKGIDKERLLSSLQKCIPSWLLQGEDQQGRLKRLVRESDEISPARMAQIIYGRTGERFVTTDIDTAELIRRAKASHPDDIAALAKSIVASTAREIFPLNDFIVRISGEAYPSDNVARARFLGAAHSAMFGSSCTTDLMDLADKLCQDSPSKVRFLIEASKSAFPDDREGIHLLASYLRGEETSVKEEFLIEAGRIILTGDSATSAKLIDLAKTTFGNDNPDSTGRVLNSFAEILYPQSISDRLQFIAEAERTLGRITRTDSTILPNGEAPQAAAPKPILCYPARINGVWSLPDPLEFIKRPTQITDEMLFAYALHPDDQKLVYDTGEALVNLIKGKYPHFNEKTGCYGSTARGTFLGKVDFDIMAFVSGYSDEETVSCPAYNTLDNYFRSADGRKDIAKTVREIAERFHGMRDFDVNVYVSHWKRWRYVIKLELADKSGRKVHLSDIQCIPDIHWSNDSSMRYTRHWFESTKSIAPTEMEAMIRNIRMCRAVFAALGVRTGTMVLEQMIFQSGKSFDGLLRRFYEEKGVNTNRFSFPQIVNLENELLPSIWQNSQQILDLATRYHEAIAK